MSDALARGALVQIRKPKVIQDVHRGSQASISRYSDKGQDFAYREVKVQDLQERLNFVNNLNVLYRLLDAANADLGRAYIYCLEKVGLAANDEKRVVEIYRWIEGHDLHGLTTLAPPLVAELGYCLAKGLRLIHSENILHRDIRPRNVILDSKRKQPVLIDFELARRTDDTGHTTLSDEFAAPEVREGRIRQGKPNWTPAADVYSLAATLQALVSGRKEIPGDLSGLHDRCTSEDLDMRPGSRGDALVAAFENVKTALRVDAMKESAWQELQIIFGADRSNRWFQEVIEKFRPTIEAHALGLYTEPYRQAQVVADFFNQTLEACPNREIEDLKSLEEEYSGSDADSVKLVRDMRNLESHGHDQEDARFKRYSGYHDGRLRRLSSRAGEIIGEECRLKNLERFVEWVFGAE